MEKKSNKTIVLECYRKIIRDLDLSLVDEYVREDYIQHSPTIKTGRQGILEMLAFLQTLPKTPIERSPIIRVISDNDYVAVHLDIKFMGKRLAVIDLYWLERGQLAEHWDAGQVIPSDDPGAVTMTNGPATINDAASGNRSKQLIRNLYKLLCAGHLKEAKQFLSEDFVEHNQMSPLFSEDIVIVKIHKVIGEGDFVVSQCEVKKKGRLFALYSIFRTEDNKIAEHWSVEQEVPDVMAHPNGMF